ncbi:MULTISPECIES: ATP-binding protein [unclassified Cupriavidus]|uniref:ATP-binding protein n=1 Tax=Cupriavidus sp. H19C3 TaxID=3241603 RepID=UPI003BF86B57
MQQILDRTEEALAQAFEALARNARRQRHLYYGTAGMLIAIVLVSAVLLAGLAAARQLDHRRSQVAQYVSGISLLLQGEVSFLRRTDLTVRYNREAPPRPQADIALMRQVQQSGVGELPDAGYALLVPEPTRAAWARAGGHAMSEQLWRLQQIATAAITTQQAFELEHRAYIVDANAEYAIVIGRSHLGQDAYPLRADLAADLRDRVGRALMARIGQPVPRKNEQVWLGPGTDPVLGTPIMTVVSASYSGDTPTTLIAAVIPVEAILARVVKPDDPATLLLVNTNEQVIDVSPPLAAPDIGKILARARTLPREKFELTRAGVMLVQPLRAGFGSLIYSVSMPALALSLTTELAIIGAIALLLIAAIAITARYWDIHLLRRSHTEATRALESETINHVLVSATPIGLCIVRMTDYAILTSNLLADTLLRLGEPRAAERRMLPRHIIAAFPPGPLNARAGRLATAQLIVPSPPDGATSGSPRDSLTPAGGVPGASAPEHRFLQLTYAPVRYRGEDVLICAIQDVTARQQLEQRLRTAQETAESMMRARSNFFAAMSHEIRTPLNALLGNLELLARAPHLEAHAPRLRALGVAADGLRRIVNDILDFSKIDAGEMKLVAEPFQPVEALESLALSYGPMIAERPIRFYPLLSPTLDRTIVGDRTRLMQIVNNLLSNAFKFTSSGKITLNARLSTDATACSVLVCQVRDSGIGMPPDLVARIFHPFVQAEASTASRHGGTGLGLSICARLCELMGGHIAVNSVEGVGSAFTITIPVTLADADATTAPPRVRGISSLILCQVTETGAALEEWLHARGWRTHSVTALAAAQTFLNANRPNVMAVTGEYDLAFVMRLRAMRAVNVVWITRDGPPHATRRAPGVFEVTSFGHAAILAAMETALDAEAEPNPAFTTEFDPGSPVASGATAPSIAPSPSPSLPPLPAVSASASVPPPSGPTPMPTPSTVAGLRVLVAEDNPLNQTLIAEQLKTLGCSATVVGDGRQALALLEQDGYDLVLSDLHMPITDGYALLDAARASHPGLPVLAFSAVTQAGQAQDWRARGFAGHIAKPASLEDIESALRRVRKPPASAAADAAPAAPTSPVSPPVSPSASPSPTPQPWTALATNLSGQSRGAPASTGHYDDMLRTQLDTDLPELADIIGRHDTAALLHWAHRAAGAFRIVEQMALVTRCRDVERLCRGTDGWSHEIDVHAMALHASVRAYRHDDSGPTAPDRDDAGPHGRHGATAADQGDPHEDTPHPTHG